MTTAIVWFRRDLRLADHPAVAAAIRHADAVVAVHCLDPSLLAGAGPVRAAALRAHLDALDRSLEGALVVRTGDPAEVIPQVAAEVSADEVHVTEDHGPAGRRRDDRVGAVLARSDRRLVATGSNYAVEPGTIRTRGGTPYRVFTAFARAWSEHDPGSPAMVPDSTWSTVPGEGTASLPEPDPLWCPMGEAAANERLEAFVSRVGDYEADRDRPDRDATSRLSVDLKWGALHPRQVLAALGEGAGSEAFRRQLAWRDFYADVLHHRPEAAWEPLDPVVGAIPADDGPDADAVFEAWTTGQTGYPIVDAGMRQLRSEGWMHNRLRMVVASFLVKDLHLPWQRGAAHFLDRLIDGDVANNQLGWQWAAGTGTDAAPYFRIFNPVRQGERFDPDGTFVRRHVPELAQVPDRFVHRPWDAPEGPPSGYPPPIVDHAEERAESLRRLAAARGR